MLIIRKMRQTDADCFYMAFLEQGWHPVRETFQKYYAEQESGARSVFIAELDGRPVGYITLLPQAREGPFVESAYPELEDFNVLIAYQKRGIGTCILDEAEKAAKRYSDCISLAVGLHNGYGPAQRLYIQRGYVPDGTGVWYKKRILAPYAPCRNDDDLVLYLSKRL